MLYKQHRTGAFVIKTSKIIEISLQTLQVSRRGEFTRLECVTEKKNEKCNELRLSDRITS